MTWPGGDAAGTSDELAARGERFLSNLSAFLEQAQEGVQAWASQEFTGTAPDSEVTARVNAGGSLVDIHIPIMAKRSLDRESLGEAIVEAVLAAEAAAEAGKAEFLAGLTVGGVDVGAILARGEQTMRDWTGER
jgi:DNA-binding protein YbaB